MTTRTAAEPLSAIRGTEELAQRIHDAMQGECTGTHMLGYATCQRIAAALTPATGTEELRLKAARLVAEYWRDSVMSSEVLRGTGMSHPLAMVLAAMDGELDPLELGIDKERHDEFCAALGTSR